MKRLILFLCVLTISAAAPVALAQSHDDHDHAAQNTPEKLGKVHFAVSCTPEAQQKFDRAVSMLHSFWYPQGMKAFEEVSATDPNCAMAYWGVAMSRRANPLVGGPDRAALQDGLAAIAKAKAANLVTPREKDYIAAIATYYEDWEKRDYPTRVLAYEAAMQQMYTHYPEDSEAAIFYALSLNEAVTVSPADKNYTRQLKATAILEKVLAEQPEHPGALHYLIHSYDFPPLAARGLEAANRYSSVAPTAPHALHMPSHIYSMLGMWDESIKANQSALGAAPGYTHAMDFMVYAYLQQGQDNQAKALLERSDGVRIKQTAASGNPTGAVLAGYTAVSAIPARYAIERGAWAEAAALESHPSTPVADSITYFARGMGAARHGDAENAKKGIVRLQDVKKILTESKQDYWAEQTEIQITAVSAWTAFAGGKKDEALKLMRSAADREDASEKHVAMENRLWPMRELLGDMLLAMHKPDQALKEYEVSLQAARNRYRGFYGAAKAAEQARDKRKARDYYGKLVALCSHPDVDRPELAEAKLYLARK
jgi:tetratricopeptide (TPR) repeat protein